MTLGARAKPTGAGGIDAAWPQERRVVREIDHLDVEVGEVEFT
jgi:hypothetical protein